MADLASPVTVAGTLIGTVQYMSPEQIQGKDADARSDIFAFGAMLYEMLTGKRAFQGKSQLSLASAILEKDPDPIATVQPLTPPALEQIVRTCLAKDPDDRFQSAHDLKLQLQWISAGGSQVGAPAIVSSQRKKTATALTAATIAGWLIAAALGVLLLIYAGRLTSARQPVHTSIEPPAGFDFFPVADGAPALSPDGQQVAFLTAKKGAPYTLGGESLFLLNAFHRRIRSRGRRSVSSVSLLVARWQVYRLLLRGQAQESCRRRWHGASALRRARRPRRQLERARHHHLRPAHRRVAPVRLRWRWHSRRNHKDDSSGQAYTDRDPYFLPDGKHFLFVRRAKDSGSVYVVRSILPQQSRATSSRFSPTVRTSPTATVIFST